MMRLEYNTITINSERKPNIVAFVPARSASLRNSSRIIFRSAQPGFFNCTNLLHRRIVAKTSSRTSRRSANFLKGGNENVLIRMQRKRIDNLFCCVGLAWNLFVVSLFFPSIKESKGVEYACSHCKSDCCLSDCGDLRPEYLGGLEKPLWTSMSRVQTHRWHKSQTNKLDEHCQEKN